MTQFKGRSYQLSESLAFYQRSDYHGSAEEIIDTLGAIWMLAWLDSDSTGIELYLENEWRSVRNDQFIFMAPFSVIKWRFPQGPVCWKAFVSYDYIPTNTVRSCIFPRDDRFVPRCSSDVISLVKGQHQAHSSKMTLDADLAERLKLSIEGHFKDELLIDDLAKEFEVSRVSLFRHFKSRFLFSPAQYRQRLRLFETVRLVTLGESITRAAFDSGFSDLSEFGKQFRRTFYSSPSEFLRNS